MLGYVGSDAARRERTARALAGGGAPVAVWLEDAAEAMQHSGAVPDVVVLDAHDRDVDALVASLAFLDAAWPSSAVVALVDAQPDAARAILDAGVRSIVGPDAGDAQLQAAVAAAAEGRGLVDIDVVRPVIEMYGTLHAEARRRNRAVIESLAAAVEAKDRVTSRHLRAVTGLAAQLAGAVDPSLAASDDFLFGCLLHDVGKIGVPEQILTKPGPLTPEEWEVMRRHPATGARVVRPLDLDPVVTDIVLHHHERWDGRGYPDGLAGEEIPLAARVFSVCDAIEAMTAARPYRRPLPVQVAFERVRLEAGHQFDPYVVEALADGVRRGDIDLEAATAPLAAEPTVCGAMPV
jgi:putative nucleotidyltransferase with HDIG domain